MTTLAGWIASSQGSLTVGLVALVAVGVQGWLVWRLIDAMRTVRVLEERFAHFGDALGLLTETTETGFVTIANELSKHSGDSLPHKPARISNARINAAARRGSTVSEIAAAEQLSETEVRLRMHLSKQMAPAKTSAAASTPAPKPAPTAAQTVAAVMAAAAAGKAPLAAAAAKPQMAPGKSARTTRTSARKASIVRTTATAADTTTTDAVAPKESTNGALRA